MSKTIWTPEGNTTQTGIDMEIASLENQRGRALFELSLLRKNLTYIEEVITETKECLDQLKGDVLIVSISEFGIIKDTYNKFIINKTRQIDLIKSINKAISGYEDKIKKLETTRKENSTKILEFR